MANEPHWHRTGKRRFVRLNWFVGNHYGPLMLEIEETSYTGTTTTGWDYRWRFAEPQDLPGETIVGLSST